jgi:tetratricopeptide (TPR) repeat protein
MKKILYLLLFSSQILLAQNGFEAANTLYKTGNYKDAILEYESILDGKKQSSELYFNLANCYYKLNKVAPAIYNYEKALLINPNNLEAQNNLQIAQKMQVDDIKIIKKVGFTKWFLNLTSAYHYNNWAWIAVTFGGLFLLFFLCYYFLDKTLFKRIFFVLMCVCLIGILISVFCAIFQKNQYKNDKPAIVFAAVTALKKEPTLSSKDIMILHEGTKVFVLSSKNRYKKVQLTDDTIGWIKNEDIKELKF